MLRHERSAPIWLFSFVDLAFLLLIAFTQIGPDTRAQGPVLAELEIPQIESDAPALAATSGPARWQIRVHPALPGDPSTTRPFELIEPAPAGSTPKPVADPNSQSGPQDWAQRVDATDLAARLRLLETRKADRPILTPHRDSRSEDLLVAVGLLADVWQQDRAVAVLPRPAVASGPGAESAR